MASQILLLGTNEGKRKICGFRETYELGVKKDCELVRVKERILSDSSKFMMHRGLQLP